eukprot:gene13461-14806_t
MGGLVSSSRRSEDTVNRVLRRNDTAPSETSHSRRSSGKDGSERWAARFSLRKARLSSQRRKELDAYSNIFVKNSQSKTFLNYNHQFIEYLKTEWISQIQSIDPHETNSPRSSSNHPKLRRKLDQLIHELMAKTSVEEEVYHTIFSGYDLDLKSNGHNKVVHLNHLKRRNSSILILEKDELFRLTNPYISIELLQDWLLLIFWSIFIVEQPYISNNTAVPTPPTSTTASVIQTIRSSGKVVPFEDNDHNNNNVLPFEDIKDDKNSNKSKPKEGNHKRSSFNYLLSTSQKLLRRFQSLTNSSDKSSKEDSLPPIQSNDLKEKQTLLKYSDIIGTNAHNNHEQGFVNYVLSGDWCNPSTFLTSLEIVNVAISILSVDSAIITSTPSTSPSSSSFPIIYVNGTWESMTGYDREDVLGKDITLFMGAETEESQSSRLGSCIKSGLRLKIGMNLLKSDQTTYIYSLLTVIPVYDHSKNYKYVIIKLYDINLLTTNLIDLKHSDEVITMISLALRNF